MLTIGADPEVFVTGANGIMGAHEVAQYFGTKDRPLKTEHGAVQVDGLALEFNVTPAETADGFVKNTTAAMNDLKSIVHNIDRDMDISIKQTHEFDMDYYNAIPEKSKRIGCDPDFNAYGEVVGVPRDPPGWLHDSLHRRHTGGHIHLGWTKQPLDSSDQDMWAAHLRLCAAITRQLDYFVGLPLVAITLDRRRLGWYGQAGSFRPKSYGLEYRSPSNVWLNSEELMRFVFNQTKLALKQLKNGYDLYNSHHDACQYHFRESLSNQTLSYCRLVGNEAANLYMKHQKVGLL